MSKKIIHQIFLDIGKGPLTNFPSWMENMKVNKRLNPDYQFILWTDTEVNSFIESHYPQYREVIDSFPHKFYLIDFVRYLILTVHGGMYMDLDVRCKVSLPDVTTILGSSYFRPEKTNNNVIKLASEHYPRLTQYCLSEYERISTNNLYKNWPVRRFLNTVSASMFDRFCRHNKIISDVDFRDTFYDEESRSWVDPNNGLIKKDYHHREPLGKPPKN